MFWLMQTFADFAFAAAQYIDIITRGAKHYGVKQHFIDWLATVCTSLLSSPLSLS
jgi:hypothetical protein